MMGVVAWVGVGAFGGLGALARFRIGGTVGGRFVTDFPAGTFVVNMTGGFVLGLLVGLSLNADLMLVLGTGFLGGYTTFSTWMVEVQRLGEDDERLLLYTYLFGSMLVGVAAAGAGWLLGGLAA
jgi:CrcB protein